MLILFWLVCYVNWLGWLVMLAIRGGNTDIGHSRCLRSLGVSESVGRWQMAIDWPTSLDVPLEVRING